MNKRPGSEERMEEGSSEAKRRKTGKDDFRENNPSDEEERMEICNDDDRDDSEKDTSILPPEVVNMVLSRLPYEKLAHLALEQEDCERIACGLLVRGLVWATEAERKWLDWDLESAFRCRVSSAWTELLSAFETLRHWQLSGEDMTTPLHHHIFLLMARTLDQVERGHRDMLATVAAIHTHHLQLQL